MGVFGCQLHQSQFCAGVAGVFFSFFLVAPFFKAPKKGALHVIKNSRFFKLHK